MTNLIFDCNHFVKIKSGHLHIAEVETDIGVTNRYLTKGGKAWIPVMGEFHFSRFPCEQWEDEILKMRAGGITILSTYIFWIHHEENEGEFNFTGDRDLERFLSLCQRHKMLVLLRIGPWCHGEVVYGGFPQFIQKRQDKRTNSPAYLEKVRTIYKKYYEQSKDYFYQNNSVVIGIQLENEYDGPDKDHLIVLRQLALDVGFVLPLYTQTAWPINTVASNKLLPMFGTYPEQPWDGRKTPLPTDNRFRIIDSRADDGIGSDILKPSKLGETTYDDFPFATCELGCGNQVTEHRRPVISSDDAYSILLIYLARGMNLPGYYMYHGGRNPYGGLYQESKRTSYPNNCPVISYDFQSPLSEYGYLRESYHRLKLIHYFLQCFGSNFALTQSMFAQKTGTQLDVKTAVRINENGEGYVLVNNYQRLDPFEDIESGTLTLLQNGATTTVPLPSVPCGSSILFPFRFTFHGFTFLYITAQPICTVQENGIEKLYLFTPDGVDCTFEADGDFETQATQNGDKYELAAYDESKPAITFFTRGKPCEVYILSQKTALDLWYVNDRVFFSKDTVLPYEDKVLLLKESSGNVPAITLEQEEPQRQRYDYYLYSRGEKAQYRLHVPQDAFESCEDIRLECAFSGNAVQIYAAGVLMADYFNIDGTLTIGLRRFKQEVENGTQIIIKLAAMSKHKKVYLERELERDTASLAIRKVTVIERTAQSVWH